MPTVIHLKPNTNTMKTIIKRTLILSFLSLLSITNWALNPADQKNPDFTPQVKETEHFQSIYNFWSYLPCDSVEKIIEPEIKQETKADQKEENITQPIIGGYLGMILFQPNFFEQTNPTNTNKG